MIRSARGAIAVRYLAIVIPLLVAFAFALEVWLRFELKEELRTELAREAELVHRHARATVAATPDRAAACAAIASQLVFIEHAVKVSDERGLLARSTLDPPAEADQVRSPLARDGITVEVAAPLAEVEETVKEYRIAAAVALLLTFVLAGGGGYLLAASALRPVDEIAAAAARIDASSLDDRLPARPVKDELGRLVETLNRMLARIEAGVQAARRFTQDASHELKTPLAAIKGTVDVALRARRSPEEYEKDLQAIGREVERLEAIVRDLLTIARADAAALVEKRERVDLRALLDEVAEVGEILAQERGTTLHRPGAGAALPVEGDLARLRQVLLNLVDNALRYGKPGGNVWLTLAAEGGHALIGVEDDGPGIPAAEREKVFERFHRLRRDVPGVGLGLAIARAIAEGHRGTLVALERPGGGARLLLRLPLA